MEKAHLYEALFLVNHGIDEAVRGVQRLKKCPKLFMETYHKSMAGLERRRFHHQPAIHARNAQAGRRR